MKNVKTALNQKCPTCGYQLVALDNDELAKLTDKAAYHELRQQRDKLAEALRDCIASNNAGDSRLAPSTFYIAREALARWEAK